MIDGFLQSTLLFGLVFTILVYWFFHWLSKRLNMPLLSPMLCSIAVMIALLKIFNVSYETYNASAHILDYLVGPATVAMAIPLYRKISYLKGNALAILVGVFSGLLSTMALVTVLAVILKLDYSVFNGILTKSVTTAVAREVTAELGGNVPLTVICVCITGNVGAAVSGYLPKWFGIKDEIAMGVAIGTSSHAMGTSGLMEHSQLGSAISSLSLVIAAIMTVIMAPIVSGLFW